MQQRALSVLGSADDKTKLNTGAASESSSQTDEREQRHLLKLRTVGKAAIVSSGVLDERDLHSARRHLEAARSAPSLPMV